MTSFFGEGEVPVIKPQNRAAKTGNVYANLN